MWSPADRRLDKYGADVYRCYDIEGNLLYVGCTINVHKRLGEHRPYAAWFPMLARFTVDRYPTRRQALEVEGYAIIHERPLYNVTKNYSYAPTSGGRREFPDPIEHDDFELLEVGRY